MTSKINTSGIDVTYPIAGQDNDTQGFRTNFTSIKNNLTYAGTEITALQANAAVSAVIVGVPASPTAIGTAGSIAYNATHLYVCIATNSWLRASLATWP